MIHWLLYLLASSALFALAARAAEEVATLYGRPTRWVWTAALAASVLVPVVGAVVTDPLVAMGEAPGFGAESAPGAASVLAGPPSSAASTAADERWLFPASPYVERALLLVWIGASLVLMVVPESGTRGWAVRAGAGGPDACAECRYSSRGVRDRRCSVSYGRPLSFRAGCWRVRRTCGGWWCCTRVSTCARMIRVCSRSRV